MPIARRIILGIDPGTQKMGYGIVAAVGAQYTCLALGYKDLRKENTYDTLRAIGGCMEALIREYKVDELAIEQPFMGKNVQSFFKLARAQGVAIAVARKQEVAVYEYLPNQVKISIGGRGRMHKKGILQSLEQHLKIKIMSENLDATDALSIAFSHALRRSRGLTKTDKKASPTRKKTWAAYLAAHPERLRNP